MPRKPPGQPKYSPGALILAREGIYLDQIAVRLECSRAHVSMLLSGQTWLRRPELLEAITDIAGDEVSAEVAATLDTLETAPA